MTMGNEIENCIGFDWVEKNLQKNWEKHRVSASECEQIFYNRPLIIIPDKKHSEEELRYYALGHTDAGRLLFVVFTVRDYLIRVISARNMNRKERKRYDKS